MPAHLTAAEFRALGLSAAAKGPVKVTTARKAPRVRAPWHTRCCTCGEEFAGETAEERHLIEQHHPRFENVL